ncbi:hypothetical protein ACIRBX_00700 [Kitasatospora sp. NPDC096147]|uniref:hypothetical protein n=1 Tax=Kitasatospora sp. NPDC096147 TaxID=3364093 RepID=UPI0038179C52
MVRRPPAAALLPSVALAALLSLAALLALTGCGADRAPALHHHADAPPSASAAGPSEASRMVCGGFVLRQLAGALGSEPVSTPVGSWDGRVYRCPYRYPAGELVLSVRESGGRAAATADFEAARSAAGRAVEVTGLGEAAFTGADGSTVVRKDGMVLTVEVGSLPEGFGVPPRSRADVSVMAATTVMTCWKEHSG